MKSTISITLDHDLLYKYREKVNGNLSEFFNNRLGELLEEEILVSRSPEEIQEDMLKRVERYAKEADRLTVDKEFKARIKKKMAELDDNKK